jgi:hypothetical protein
MAKVEYAVKSLGRDSRGTELYLRVVSHPGWSNYRAWGIDNRGIIEFRGTTGGYTKDIEEILRRMVKAPWEPPEVVVRTAEMLFEHFEAYLRHVDVYDDDFVGTAVEYKDPESPYRSFVLHMAISTIQVDVMDRVVTEGGEVLGSAEPGWVVTISCEYRGYDGVDGEGKHLVRRKIAFRGRINPEVVWAEMMRVVKYAVNALPSE